MPVRILVELIKDLIMVYPVCSPSGFCIGMVLVGWGHRSSRA
jgi:hypothetical protein